MTLTWSTARLSQQHSVTMKERFGMATLSCWMQHIDNAVPLCGTTRVIPSPTRVIPSPSTTFKLLFWTSNPSLAYSYISVECTLHLCVQQVQLLPDSELHILTVVFKQTVEFEAVRANYCSLQGLSGCFCSWQAHKQDVSVQPMTNFICLSLIILLPVKPKVLISINLAQIQQNEYLHQCGKWKTTRTEYQGHDFSTWKFIFLFFPSDSPHWQLGTWNWISFWCMYEKVRAQNMC